MNRLFQKPLKNVSRKVLGENNPFDDERVLRSLGLPVGARKARSRKAAPRSRNPVPRVSRTPAVRSIAAASAYGIGLRSTQPRVQRNGFLSTRIKHRELLFNIVGTSTFTSALTVPLQPGLPAFGPWIATQAQGWEQYRLHQVKVCYYSRCGTATPGTVMLVPDYNSADSAPTNETLASSFRDTVEDVPWTPEFTLTCDPVSMAEPGPRKYIRTGPLQANQDIKTYDSGQVFICTNDGTAVNWGKAWIEYDVEFFVPVVPAQSVLSGGSVANPTGLGLGSNFPLGTSIASSGSIGLTFSGVNCAITNLIVGESYKLTYSFGGTTASGSLTMNAVSGATMVTNPFNFISTSTTGKATQNSGLSATFTATLPTAVISVNNVTVTGPLYALCECVQMPVLNGVPFN